MPALTTHEALLDWAQTTLATLDLDGAEQRVYRRFILSEAYLETVQCPCVIVSPYGTKTDESKLNSADDWGLPLTVYLIDQADGASQPDREAMWLLWRRRVEVALNKRNPGPTYMGVYNVTYQSGPVVLTEGVPAGLVILPVMFRGFARETRTQP